ncbi:alcohol dehydrogenase catalytic domain-containing protein [Streptomyces phaeochromogenes]
MKPGTVLGHEAVGEVMDVGREVHSAAVREQAIVSSLLACGLCQFCRGAEGNNAPRSPGPREAGGPRLRAQQEAAAASRTGSLRPREPQRCPPAVRPGPGSETLERGRPREERSCSGRRSSRTPHPASHRISPTTTRLVPVSPGRRRAPHWPGCPAVG